VPATKRRAQYPHDLGDQPIFIPQPVFFSLSPYTVF